MRFKLKIFISILVAFFLLEINEIKAHNSNNGDCKEHCFNIINRKPNEGKIKVFKNKKKLIRENNSCLNNSLCRG